MIFGNLICQPKNGIKLLLKIIQTKETAIHLLVLKKIFFFLEEFIKLLMREMIYGYLILKNKNGIY